MRRANGTGPASSARPGPRSRSPRRSRCPRRSSGAYRGRAAGAVAMARHGAAGDRGRGARGIAVAQGRYMERWTCSPPGSLTRVAGARVVGSDLGPRDRRLVGARRRAWGRGCGLSRGALLVAGALGVSADHLGRGVPGVPRVAREHGGRRDRRARGPADPARVRGGPGGVGVVLRRCGAAPGGGDRGSDRPAWLLGGAAAGLWLVGQMLRA